MTVASPDTELLTADDLLLLEGQGVRGELIRGVLRETMPTGVEHGQIVVNLVICLGNFVKPRRLGRLMASDSGVWLERDPDTVREPDVAYFSAQKMPLGARITHYAQVSPDLVAEVASPSDSRRKMADRALMWLSFGVRLVWIAHPDTRTVDVHRPGRSATSHADGDTLDGHDVLPGFTCGVREVFDA